MKDSCKVIFIGDSRKMKGGVSTVMKTLETSSFWKEHECHWLQTQINSNIAMKLLYLLRGCLEAIWKVPQYDVVYFQTTAGPGMLTLLPIFLYSLLCKKRIITQLHMGNQIKSYAKDHMFQFWAKHSDKFVFLGKTWMEELKEDLPATTQTDYLYNPVPLHSCQTSYEKYFLYAAYFTQNKGCDVFLKAFRKVVDKYPEWKCIMCGAGETEWVESLVKEYGISDNVVMPGWVSGTEKDTLFKNAFAYCMTSYQEGLPMSVLESLSYGVPVISTPVGCLPEVLEEGRTSLFFDFGNSEKLSKRMMQLIEDEPLRQELSRQSYMLAKDKFSLESVISKLEKIIKF